VSRPLNLSTSESTPPTFSAKKNRSGNRHGRRRRPIVEALAWIMDVHNDGKEDKGEDGE